MAIAARRFAKGVVAHTLPPTICIKRAHFMRSERRSGFGKHDVEQKRERDVALLAKYRPYLGGKRFEYVLALLAFIRTAHFWTVVHPGIEMEDDVKELLGEYKELAALLLQEPDPWSA